MLLRVLFALFFYSSFIIGIATIVWWRKYQVGLYPAPHILGIALLLASIYIRRTIFRKAPVSTDALSKFYMSIALLIISLAFGYGSSFVLVYAVVIGLPLVFLQQASEKKQLIAFERFVHGKQKSSNIDVQDYSTSWQQYLEKRRTKKSK
jgi:hypothetical protein